MNNHLAPLEIEAVNQIAGHPVKINRTGVTVAHPPNGIDLSEFSAPPVPKTAGTPLKIISISRLVPVKRIADALLALAKLRDQAIEFNYVAIGEGPERTALEELTGRLGLTDRVTFLGVMSHEEVVKELSTSDILLHPSELESFGIAVAEAMAARVAVIAARSPGPMEIVDQGVTGFLYEPGDVEALADHLYRLATDPPLRKRFGELGHARVLERFSWDAHMSQMFELWRASMLVAQQERV